MAMLLIAIWFLLWGVLQVTNITFAMSNVVLGIIAILIAVLLFWEGRGHFSRPSP
jgi:hypothetical protein